MRERFWYFAGPAVILALVFGVISLALPREEILMGVNGRHSPFTDLLFRAWTRLGEYWILAGVLVVAVFIRLRPGLVMLLSFAVSGLAAQFFKRVVFGPTPRPLKFFEIEEIEYTIHQVEGVDFYHWFSFPSGHTTAAFGVLFGLSLFLPRIWNYFLLLLALGVGYSRIYLGQAFSGRCGGRNGAGSHLRGTLLVLVAALQQVLARQLANCFDRKMKNISKSIWVYLGIMVFAVLFFLPFLGSVHLFDWDEINFAESAREMMLTGDYVTVQIDYKPFWEKPPLFFWMQVLSMKAFGVNEFAARFPNFICGILSLLVLYYLGKKLYSRRFGLFWVLSYGSAILPFFYFRSGIIDPWFNLFIFMGVAWFVFYLDPGQRDHRIRNLVLSGLLFGLAILTKGPVAILLFFLCFVAYLSLKRFRLDTKLWHVLLFIGVVGATGGTWFLLQVLNGNSQIVGDFVRYQIRLLSTGDAGHSGFFAYHFVVLLLGVFPASVIALKSFTRKSEDRELQRIFKQWMYILFWVVLIIFSIVKTKILHYSSLTYFPFTFLAAWVWDKWMDRKIEISVWQVILILVIGLVYAGISIVIPLALSNSEWLLARDYAFLDSFVRATLEAPVHWSGTEWLIGVFMFVGVVAAAIQILRRNPSGMIILYIVSLLFVSSSIYLFTDRIEGYTQRTAIKFYKSLKGQDVYVNTLGFKSYAHLYYFDKQPGDPDFDDSPEYLLNNELDKDAYFVIKENKKERYLERYPQLEVVRESNGFVFTVKRAGISND
jgi:4-amino-4-deoxy-L-arabinose transferase-like glycosyltransferase/membrane-associated phospholipid phosphatase